MPNWKKVITSGSDATLNSLNLSSVVNAATDTDKFLVLDSAGNVDFRTGDNVKSDIGLSNVENTALSNWAGSTNITTLGTITTGTWQGSAISTTYIANTSGTNTGDEPDASTTVKGIVELATTAETTTGTDTTRAVTPNGLENGFNGSTNITTLGTIATGVWQGSEISTTYIANTSGTNTGDEPDATTSTKGIVELATTAETTTGTDTTRAVTPDGLKDGYQGSTNVTTLGTISTGEWVATDIGLAHGGTGASLADPNDDRILFWDDSVGSVAWLDIGTGLSITNQTISATVGGGSGYEWFDGTTYASASVDVRVTGSIEVYKSGSTGDDIVMAIDGAQGRLFEVTDQLSGSLFSVNDISGIPIFEVFSDDTVNIGTFNDEAIVVEGNEATIGLANGTVGAPSLNFTSDGNTGFYRSTTDTIAIAINGQSKFNINSSRAYVAGALGVGTTTPTTTGLIRATNDVVAFYSSDERLKDNIKKIENPIDKLENINGVEFDWIPMEGIHENEGHDVGVIAQEVEKVIPEIVETRDNGYKAVKYEKIVPLLIESIKELKDEIEKLKGRL